MSPPIIVALSSTKSYAHNYLILVLKLAKLAHSPFCETPHTSAHLSLLKPCPLSSPWPGPLLPLSFLVFVTLCDPKLLCITLSVSCARDPGHLNCTLYYNSLCVYILHEFLSALVSIIFIFLPAAASTVYWMQYVLNICLLDLTC